MGTANDLDIKSGLGVKVSGLILAGGEGRRMSGQDKGLISLADKPLVEYAIECLMPLVDDLAISCNRNVDLYENYQLPCISDTSLDENQESAQAAEMSFAGPMAGLAAGLKQAKHDWLLVMPCDTPLMTEDVMAQLIQAISRDSVATTQAVIFSHHGLQPLHGLYHKSMLPIFNKCLAENKNALHKLLNSMSRVKIIEAKDAEYRFNNANDLEELNTIEGLIETLLTT